MATIFDSLPLHGFTRAHISQLRQYVLDRDREGSYYGNREQYEKRHKEILEMLNWAVEYAYSEGVKFPKAIKNE